MASDTDKTMRTLLGALGLRRTPVAAPARPATTVATPRAKKHHAVSIEPGHHACVEANALRGKRFLSREAPPLPLTKCPCEQCECRYVHHEDRRARSRRARDVGVTVDEYVAKEQRVATGRGRRESDR